MPSVVATTFQIELSTDRNTVQAVACVPAVAITVALLSLLA
ncbi:hypothetical protein [Antrihabitans cavernicola]|nr:hypothetical protein [Spelaeibacter cavernicola]